MCAQARLTLCDLPECGPPDLLSPVFGQEYQSKLFLPSRGSSHLGSKPLPVSPALQVVSLPAEASGKPKQLTANSRIVSRKRITNAMKAVLEILIRARVAPPIK